MPAGGMNLSSKPQEDALVKAHQNENRHIILNRDYVLLFVNWNFDSHPILSTIFDGMQHIFIIYGITFTNKKNFIYGKQIWFNFSL